MSSEPHSRILNDGLAADSFVAYFREPMATPLSRSFSAATRRVLVFVLRLPAISTWSATNLRVAWLVINKIRFCLGSTRVIFFPAATHSFAHRGPVAVYSPEEARPRAHVSSASQPCRTVVSGRSAIANSATIPRKTTRQKDLLIGNSKVPTNLCPFPARSSAKWPWVIITSRHSSVISRRLPKLHPPATLFILVPCPQRL